MKNIKKLEDFLHAYLGVDFVLYITSKHGEKRVSVHFDDDKITVTAPTFKGAFFDLTMFLIENYPSGGMKDGYDE